MAVSIASPEVSQYTLAVGEFEEETEVIALCCGGRGRGMRGRMAVGQRGGIGGGEGERPSSFCTACLCVHTQEAQVIHPKSRNNTFSGMAGLWLIPQHHLLKYCSLVAFPLLAVLTSSPDSWVIPESL